MIPIIQKENPILRHKAHEVPLHEIESPHIKDVINRMIQALDEQDDGVAIAAPQIGESLRIFVVSGKVFTPNYPDMEPGESLAPHMICINPEIIKLSKMSKKMAEGCLSVRWLYGKVRRASKAMIKGFNEKGEPFTRGGSGLLSQIFQHEIDHLNGILFIDMAEDIEDLPPSAAEALAKEAKQQHESKA
jgi:peptide deformylase